MQIESPAFVEGEIMPAKYTCDGKDISPPLTWSDVPKGAKNLAIICNDPDAPLRPWVHWIIYCISPEKNGFPENMPRTETLDEGMKQGKNSWGRIGYGGPCPPGTKPHRYYFKLYALDIALTIGPGVKKKQLSKTMEGHILAEAELMGKYVRKY